MDWIELTIHTTTAGADIVSEALMAEGATGTMVEDRADIPDPDKPNGYWEIIDPNLISSMPEDVLVHAWFTPDSSFADRMQALRRRCDELHHMDLGLDLGTLEISTLNVHDEDWAEVWKKFYKPFKAGRSLVVKPTWEHYDPQPGDRIIEINDTLVAGQKIPQRDVVKKLRGPRGTTVHLGLGRQGIGELVGVDVLRDKIPIKSIESAFRIADGIGYIKLGQFARTTSAEMEQALASLRAEGVTKLIFDLRGNSGGYLDQAILVANEFLHKEQLIVYTEDRHHQQQREYADGTGSAQDMDVVVLIDEGSASSSEILAGALQDNDRGTIVGRRSFGKGLVQRQIPYSDGSALRLTTARYYTPTGRSIQKPYTIGDDESYEEDIWNRYRNNEFFSADSIHFADSLKRTTPGGKVVYGGGGIMPDVFVPADTTDVTKYFVEVAGRNILYRYTIEYADRHREALNAVKTIPELQALLDGDRGLVEDFIRYAARQGVAPNYRDIARSRKLIEAQLRAYIGRNTALEDNGFYANIYPVDNVIVRAVGILNETREND